MSPLTKTQTLILEAAATRADGNIEPLPPNVNAGVKPRVIESLLKREVIEAFHSGIDESGYRISAVGYEAIGQASSAIISRGIPNR